MRRPSILGFAFALAACGDSGDGGDDTDTAYDGPLYVIANEVYTADSSTTYVNVLHSLDVDQVDYTKAIEYAGGRATIATVGGWLFVGEPEAPVITRFAVAADGTLVQDGQISFANYGFESIWIDEWGNTFISPTKAYLMNSDDGTTIVWDPTTMAITGEIAPSQNLVRGNQLLNGSPGLVRGDRLFRTFFWSDWDAYATSTEQYLAVYDVTTDTMIALVPESRCPGLSNRIERDEAGNLYASNWVHNVTETLVRGAPSSCAVRIAAVAEVFDPTWTLPFTAVTDGREGAMFSVLGGGQGLLNVFHDERATFDDQSDPSELAATLNWRLWHVDAADLTGAPVEGLDWMAGGASTFHLDGRTFVLVPGADYSITRISEIVDGAAVPSFDVTGWSYQFLRMR